MISKGRRATPELGERREKTITAGQIHIQSDDLI